MDPPANGPLGDSQVFQSFGYENLYEPGFVDYQLWKHFQKQKLDKDITALDDGFCAIDDEEVLSTSDSEFRSTTSFVEEAMADGALKDLTEPLLDIDNEIQGPFSRPAGTENPKVYISTTLNMTDGPDAHGYSHPSAIRDFGQLSGASHQSDENVLAPLCPPISGKLQTGLEQNLDIELRLAVQAGDKVMVQLLLDCGADVNEASWSENSPLSLAIRAGHEEIVQLLLDCGADVNKASWSENLPLSLTVQKDHKGMIQLFLDCGAALNRAVRFRNRLLSLIV